MFGTSGRITVPGGMREVKLVSRCVWTWGRGNAGSNHFERDPGVLHGNYSSPGPEVETLSSLPPSPPPIFPDQVVSFDGWWW